MLARDGEKTQAPADQRRRMRGKWLAPTLAILLLSVMMPTGEAIGLNPTKVKIYVSCKDDGALCTQVCYLADFKLETLIDDVMYCIECGEPQCRMLVIDLTSVIS